MHLRLRMDLRYHSMLFSQLVAMLCKQYIGRQTFKVQCIIGCRRHQLVRIHILLHTLNPKSVNNLIVRLFAVNKLTGCPCTTVPNRFMLLEYNSTPAPCKNKPATAVALHASLLGSLNKPSMSTKQLDRCSALKLHVAEGEFPS